MLSKNNVVYAGFSWVGGGGVGVGRVVALECRTCDVLIPDGVCGRDKTADRNCVRAPVVINQSRERAQRRTLFKHACARACVCVWVGGPPFNGHRVRI